jgi:hypothetical protein
MATALQGSRAFAECGLERLSASGDNAPARPADGAVLPPARPRVVELRIVDEAARLKELTLERSRDLYDRTN